MTNDNGEDTYCKTIYLQIVGTEEFVERDGVLIYPNPVTGKVYLERRDGVFSYWDRVELVDVNGRVVREWRNVNVLSVEGIPEGLYALQLSSTLAISGSSSCQCLINFFTVGVFCRP